MSRALAIKEILQNAAGATGNGTALDVAGLATVGLQVEGITTATVIFEGTIDGTTWYAVESRDVRDGTAASQATADGLFMVPVAGLAQIRARISAWTAGAITVTALAVAAAAPMPEGA